MASDRWTVIAAAEAVMRAVMPADNLTPTARATRDRWAVILEAEAIVRAEYERRFASLEARMDAIRRETGR